MSTAGTTPRMPTLRGLRRRGYPPEAIREFANHIGIARMNGVARDRAARVVRAHAPQRAPRLRRMAVLDPIEVVLDQLAREVPDGPRVRRSTIPRDEADGTREVPFSGRLFIERDDFMLDPPKKFFRLAPGREVRLRAGYFITCTDVETDAVGDDHPAAVHLRPGRPLGGQAPDGRKVKATIHWVSAEHAVDADGAASTSACSPTPTPEPTEGEDPLASLNPRVTRDPYGVQARAGAGRHAAPGEVVQFERLGYFAHDLDDAAWSFHRTVGLRDEWANIQKRQGRG